MQDDNARLIRDRKDSSEVPTGPTARAFSGLRSIEERVIMQSLEAAVARDSGGATAWSKVAVLAVPQLAIGCCDHGVK